MPSVRTPGVEQIPGLAVLDNLARFYQQHGHRLALTGGAVRDFLMGRPYIDLDVVSDARPARTQELLTRWAGHAVHSDNPFGVVSCTAHDLKIQVLTYRTPRDRYPDFDPRLLRADPLENQLMCADVTINTAAILLPGHEWLDPFGAAADVAARMLRPPVDPHVAILSHPPTMLRYARFVAELGFQVSPEMLAAMRALAATLEPHLNWGTVVTLTKILTAPDPPAGVAVLQETGLLRHLPLRWQDRLCSGSSSEQSSGRINHR